MEIVGDFEDTGALLEAVAGADVAVIGAHHPEDSALAQQMLKASHSLRVLIIATNGGSAVLSELRPQMELLDDVSPESLITAIRAKTERA